MAIRSVVTGRFIRRSRGRIADRSHADGMMALLVPAALVGVGLIMWKKQSTPLNGVNGPYGAFPLNGVNGPYGAFPLNGVNGPYGAFPLAGLGSRFKRSFSKVTAPIKKITSNKIMRPVLAVATGGASEMVKKSISVATDPGNTIKKDLLKPINMAASLPGGKKLPLVKKFGTSTQNATPAAEQAVVYQDANGNDISKAEYDALIQAVSTGQAVYFAGKWAMPNGVFMSNADYMALNSGGGGYNGPQSPPILPQPHSNKDRWSTGSGSGYSSGSYGGSGYELPPEAPQSAASVQQQYAQPDTVVHTEKKFNPLIAIGALIAVPVVLGLTGHT